MKIYAKLHEGMDDASTDMIFSLFFFPLSFVLCPFSFFLFHFFLFFFIYLFTFNYLENHAHYNPRTLLSRY